MSIPFTQYLRPNGARKDITIDRSPEVEALAKSFIQSGGYFECEELRTGHVSLTACKDNDDLEIELVTNGPGVGEAIDKLVRRAVRHV